MSTAINITVDDGGLPARNRQQVAANRQALVQKIAREQSTALGLDKRSQERIAQGRDPATGALLIPPASGGGIPRLNQQPAANRLSSTALDPLLIDFATAKSAVQYFQTVTGGIESIRKLGGSIKYKGVVSQSQYSAINGEDWNPLVTENGTGPFGQSIIRTTGPSFASSASIQISYPPQYVTGWEPMPGADPDRPDLIIDPPPYRPAGFNSNLKSPHTLETDIYYDADVGQVFIFTTLRFILVENAALSNETLLKSILYSRPFSGNPPSAPYYFYIDLRRRYSTFPERDNDIQISVATKTPDSGEVFVTSEIKPLPSYRVGWNRLAFTAGKTGIRVYENTANHINLTNNFSTIIASFPKSLDGYTWIAEMRTRNIFSPSGVSSFIAVSSMRHTRKEIKGAYIPAKLS